MTEGLLLLRKPPSPGDLRSRRGRGQETRAHRPQRPPGRGRGARAWCRVHRPPLPQSRGAAPRLARGSVPGNAPTRSATSDRHASRPQRPSRPSHRRTVETEWGGSPEGSAGSRLFWTKSSWIGIVWGRTRTARRAGPAPIRSGSPARDRCRSRFLSSGGSLQSNVAFFVQETRPGTKTGTVFSACRSATAKRVTYAFASAAMSSSASRSGASAE